AARCWRSRHRVRGIETGKPLTGCSMPGRPGRHWLAALMASALVLAACRPSTPDPEPPTSVAPDTVARSDAEYTPGDVDAPPWLNALSADIAEIDAAMPGSFGVYVRRLGSDPGSLDMGRERAWYLSSTIKVPVAIAILEQVDAGELSLDEEIELRQEDFVDGSGDMVSQQPGQRFTIATLLEKSLRDSDRRRHRHADPAAWRGRPQPPHPRMAGARVRADHHHPAGALRRLRGAAPGRCQAVEHGHH